MINIKVAVRIRPFSQRELIQNDELIVEGEDKSIFVTNPKIPRKKDGDSRQRTKRFTVDFCYDAKNPQSSSQEAVYKEIGEEILNSTLEGYNACVLAYGHSASGKTYTIMGLPDDPGLTPRICQGLFDRIESKSNINFQIIVSFLEIYNEKVRDLLGKEDEEFSGNLSLRVREHPKLGPYVQDLSQHIVNNKNRLLELLILGNTRRSTAATENNNHSSRSHAVFTLRIKQTDKETIETDKTSKVHLVDLAGSERANGVQNKTRLKEGANINKSLVTLGNVIFALAESNETSSNPKEHFPLKTWQPFVPYRDSVLTWLLKDTLGGNSNTIMIATVSPASSCLNETINTLRYAKRTKRILNHPIVNEDPKIRTIRELRKEIAKLKFMLFSFHKVSSLAGENSEFNNVSSMEFENLENTCNLSLNLEEAQQQIKKEDDSDKDNLQRFAIKKQEENKKNSLLIKKKLIKENENENLKFLETEAIEKKSINWRSHSHMLLGTQRAASLVSSVCKINDEKKSDVNGSVIVSFSHETPIFLDSLESLSSLSLDTKKLGKCESNLKNDTAEVHREIEILNNVSKFCFIPKKKFKLYKKREFSSCENLTKSNFHKMLHRSRPDLIKGISGCSKEGFPSTSSQSCTDVSNLSQSNSENSLNSSGSLDAQFSEGKRLKKTRSLDIKSAEHFASKKTAKSDEFPTTFRKVNKRSEIVDAVTSRLYITKKKPDRLKATQAPEKDDCDDGGESEELKLCKRARMKLFDLSRKLAMTAKLKKTVESDSQTDFCDRTIRVKEKSVITDRSGLITFETSSTNTCPFEDLESKSTAKVIMNQVFLPPQSKYFVIECSQGVCIEVPGSLTKHDLSIQTSPEKEKSYKDVSTSPVKLIVCAEDSFSDDSLDLEEKGKINFENSSEKGDATNNMKLVGCGILNSENINLKQKSNTLQSDLKISVYQDNSLKENWLSVDNKNLNSKPTAKESQEGRMSYLNNVPLSFFTHNCELNCLNTLSNDCLTFPLKKEENFSSENSLISEASTEVGSVSETATEDFVFYTGSKDQCKARIPSDRELYTITENSEQSDLSDIFISSQNECSEKNILSRGENFSKPINNDLNDSLDRIGKKTWRSLEKPLVEKGSSTYQVFSQNIQGNAQINSFKKISSKVKMLNSKNLKDISKNSEKVPNLNFNSSEAFLSIPAKLETDFNHEDVKPQSISSRFKKTNWSDLSMNPQKQYLNFNILNSSKQSQFVVDTHLLKDFSKKDQSTETIFTSEDSITFIFMGPAKPKTSVLMEVIKRSLNKEIFKETANPQKLKNKGVQCNNKLIRSISVDTALIALSRIAKHHSLDITRTISLDTLTSEKISPSVEQGQLNGFKEIIYHCDENNCECRTNVKHLKKEPLTYSVSTSTTKDQHTETENEEMDLTFEKSKKKNSWLEKTIDVNIAKYYEKLEEPTIIKSEIKKTDPSNLFRAYNEDFREIESNENQSLRISSSENFSNAHSNSQTRRVRFSKPETRSLEDISEVINKDKDLPQLDDTFCTFLKEATSLLKNLNYFSVQQKLFSSEIIKRLKELQVEQNKERRKEPFKVSSKKFSKNLLSLDCVTKSKFSNSINSCELQKENLQNLTWPRRRSAMSKPPKAIRYTPSPKFFRSPLNSVFNSFHSNSYLEGSRNNSQSGRTTSGSTIWNASNLSTTFSNSYVGEAQSRLSSLRSVYSNRSSPPVLFSKPIVHEKNSMLDLRTELEESCRSLKIATEQDKLRQETLENKMSAEKWTSHIVNKTYVEIENMKEELKLEENKLMPTKRKISIIKRRKKNDCVYDCNCRSHKKSCTCFFSKAFRSTFELDTFGPGSKHCLQFCMFCKEKDSELYCSSPMLNSECHLGLCRLNYYGYCPCSPVKLPYVSCSPRAYMQHLLTLRRRIVNAAKRN